MTSVESRETLSLSPPGCGQVESPHLELRQFLGRLFLPHDKLHFFPILSEAAYQRSLTDPRLMATFEERNLLADHFDGRTCQVVDRPNRFPNARSTRLGSRRFDAVIAGLLDLNSIGYDIRVCPNPLAFRRYCDRTVIGVRNILLDNGGKERRRWLKWLSRNRQHGLVAVDTGEVVQINIPIQPIRNRRCITNWRQIPEDGEDASVDWPEYAEIAHRVEDLARRNGLTPDRYALRRFSGLMWCPGFTCHRSGQLVRLRHPTADLPGINPVGGNAFIPDESDTKATVATDAKPPAPRRRRRFEPEAMLFYCKVDAAEVLSPRFRRYADQANSWSSACC